MTRACSVLLALAGAACTAFDGLRFVPDAGADAAGTPADRDALAPGPYAAAVLADGPVAYYRFEDGPGTIARDATGHGHDCEYVGAVARGAASATAGLGSAIDLRADRETHLVCPEAPFEFSGTSTFSLEAWVLPRTADSVYRKVFSKDVDDPRSGYNLSVVQPGVVRAERFAGGAELCGAIANVRLDTWSHVVASYDGAVLRLYVDGELLARRECLATPMPDTATPLVLGVQSDRRYGPFDGLVDELAVYDHELRGDRVGAHREAAIR